MDHNWVFSFESLSTTFGNKKRRAFRSTCLSSYRAVYYMLYRSNL